LGAILEPDGGKGTTLSMQPGRALFLACGKCASPNGDRLGVKAVIDEKMAEMHGIPWGLHRGGYTIVSMDLP